MESSERSKTMEVKIPYVTPQLYVINVRTRDVIATSGDELEPDWN